jgi:CRISPR system Cascade subunit CasD
MSGEFVILRLSSPLMAAGSVAIDTHRYTDILPGQSLLTGLLANAFGYTHGDTRHATLQSALEFAARADRLGFHLVDYQTAQISPSHDRAWTTSGVAVGRRGQQVAEATHIRRKHYRSDALWTVALRVEGIETYTVAHACNFPARPLFIGRKACLPGGRLVQGMIEAEDVLAALKLVPSANPPDVRLSAIWPAGIDHGDPAQVEETSDLRDWVAGFHSGSRAVRSGIIEVQH